MQNLTNKTVILNLYSTLHKEIQALLSEENSFITILANSSSLIYYSLKDINWVGFYLLYGSNLKLGPFQGKVACQTIPLSKGVCGAAVTTKSVQLVNNVHEFKGHIACDSTTNSEIVLPLVINQQVIGVLDIDSAILGRFSYEDQQGLQTIASSLCEKLSHTNIIDFLQKF